MKIRLNSKEVSRAGTAADGRLYTVAVRRQAWGADTLVALVWVDTEEVIDSQKVKNKAQISAAVRDMLRTLDKLGGMGGDMADASRHRVKPPRLDPEMVASEIVKVARSLVGAGEERTYQVHKPNNDIDGNAISMVTFQVRGACFVFDGALAGVTASHLKDSIKHVNEEMDRYINAAERETGKKVYVESREVMVSKVEMRGRNCVINLVRGASLGDIRSDEFVRVMEFFESRGFERTNR
jgi:hypothetical protein